MTEDEQTSEPASGEAAPAGSEPTAEQSPAGAQPSAADQGSAPNGSASTKDQEPPESQPAERPNSRQIQPKRRRPRRNPASVADHFTACPRCSFFLVGYRLIQDDFDQAASDASSDWIDLSWNAAMRNLLTKSYGIEMSEPFKVVQGVCPDCLRNFVVEAGDEDDDVFFSMQINPRY